MEHHLHSGDRDRRTLRIGVAVTLGYVVLAFVAGLLAHSLALLSEAGHNFTDVLALLLSWYGLHLAARPADESRTYGYQRAGVMAAFFNVLLLFALTAVIVVEAVARWRSPVAVHSHVMLVVGAIGVAVNAVVAIALRHGSDVNLRAAFVHMVGDAVSSGLIIVGALVIAATGASLADPLLSLIIAGFIAWTGWDVLRETINILLEGAPRGIHPEEVAGGLRRLPGVENVHDMHIWSLGSHTHALSCHICIADIPPSESESILRAAQKFLAERYAILHTTIQFEYGLCALSEGCALLPAAAPPHSHQH